MSEQVKMISQAQFLTLQAKVDVKSVKEDDAILSVHLFDDIIISAYPVPSVLEGKSRQCLCTSLNKFRGFILRTGYQSVYSIFVK